MSPQLPPGYADVVRFNHAHTVGYVFALGPRGRKIQEEELRRVRRNLRAVTAPDLPRIPDAKSWILAVLLETGESADPLTQWAQSLPRADLDRVFVYFLPKTDLLSVLAPWLEAGLGPPPVFEVRDFPSFHKVFGKHLNDRVWLDHG